MTTLLNQVTVVTAVEMKPRPSPPKKSPTFVVDITGGTATVNLFQSNTRASSHSIGTVTESGVYADAGLCLFLGADVSEISGATVTVTVADN